MASPHILQRMQQLGLPAPRSAAPVSQPEPPPPTMYSPPQLMGPSPEELQTQRNEQLDAIARSLALQEQSSQSQLAYQHEADNLGRAQQRNTLLSGIPVLQAGHRAKEIEAQGGLANIQTNLQRALADMQRQGTFDRAELQDSMIGRGLGQSGVRLGAEGRQQADLVKRQGDTTLAAQQQRDAINRSLQSSATQAGAQAQQLMTQANLYNPLPNQPAAPSLDDLIKKYRTSLGAS